MPSFGEAGPKTTYFLGAGASAAVSQYRATTADLLRLALQSKVHEGNAQDVELASQLVRLLAHPGEEPTIDELFAIVDLALLEQLPLSPDWTLSRLADARHSLNRLIYDCIQSTIHRKEPRDGPLMKLLTMCRDGGSVIVTLNWDCLVERMFIRLMKQKKGMIDYGIQCVTQEGELVPVDDGALLVLKPHGSLSWGHCPLCGVLVAVLVKPFTFQKGRRCPHCPRTQLQFVLVPPAPYSQQGPWFLGALWDRVERAVHQSDRLVFIGYSFPSQDAHVRVHLVRALARRDRRNPLEVEVVVKADPQNAALTDLISHRYASIVGGTLGTQGFRFHADGFAAWIQETRP